MTKSERQNILFQIQDAVREWQSFKEDKHITNEAIKEITSIQNKEEYVRSILEAVGFGRFWEFSKTFLLDEDNKKTPYKTIMSEGKAQPLQTSWIEMYARELKDGRYC
jgi:hypothetical protein